MLALAEWFINLVCKGTDKAKKDVADVGKATDDNAKKATAAGKASDDWAKRLSTGLKAGLTAINNVALGAVAMAGAFAKAGFSGTGIGDQLSTSFTMLSREIASLFLPLLELVVKAINMVVGGFQKLGGAGQLAILAIGTAIAVAVAIATGGISAIFSAITGVVAVFAKLFSMTSGGQRTIQRIQELFERISNVIMPILNKLTEMWLDRFEQHALPVLEVMISQLEKAVQMLELFAKMAEDPKMVAMLGPWGQFLREFNAAGNRGGRSDVTLSGGKFEGVQDLHKRLQAAGLRGEVRKEKIPEEQLKAAQEANMVLKEIAKNTVKTVLNATLPGAGFLVP